jgi:uncharacterized protein YbcC (UPF0753/DUF2309 family)
MVMVDSKGYDIKETLRKICKFLPNQAPLKDFINQNTLEAFQDETFYDALEKATIIFGYKTTLLDDDYRLLYREGRINESIVEDVIIRKKGLLEMKFWKDKLLKVDYPNEIEPRIGQLRKIWERVYDVDIDSYVHGILFRVLCSYLDQGISIWNFPVHPRGFIASLQELEKNTSASFFKTDFVKKEFLLNKHTIESLLSIVVGQKSELYEHYLFDQQWAHQGWSGIVHVIEKNPSTLLEKRKISIEELIFFELMLEWDSLIYHLGSNWKPLEHHIQNTTITPLFAPIERKEFFDVIELWQESFEWTYYDQVLAGILEVEKNNKNLDTISFQGLFCIDDREGSLRRYLEIYDPNCETYSTPGHFNVEFYYKPDNGKYITKLCPPPLQPKYLIKEYTQKKKWEKDIEFSKQSNSLLRGWLYSLLIGFGSVFKLFKYIFKPNMSPTVASSFKHMESDSKLSIVYDPNHSKENNLQIGFTIDEMSVRVEGLLKSIGLTEGFAPIIYIVGHGSSSINNPHYAAYDCGACSGRPGSVNARVFSFMANHPKVREELAKRGIYIPSNTQFLGALHDTTRDDIVYFDEDKLSNKNIELHRKHQLIFAKALNSNAKERSRRFKSINTKLSEEKIHKKVQERSVSLFQPRPELDHATNALCIVGNRYITKGLFLDRRAFMNSYDYKKDLDGVYLSSILNAATPVCGGINLQYYFSRVDNQKLGSGTKLPHNVMGLIGVANGTDGDLRPGLPLQAIEVHDPVRLLMIVEHFPRIVQQAIEQNEATYAWYSNGWVNLVVFDPMTRFFYRWTGSAFEKYSVITSQVQMVTDLKSLIESNEDNFPVYVIKS